MTLVRICWYFCLLFAISLVAASLSIPPGGETSIHILMGVELCLSIASGTAAVLLRKHVTSNPDARMFRSKTIRNVGVGVAVILTLLVVSALFG